MAKYSAVKATVNAYIKQNGRKEITGRILNAVLNATIDSLGKYFQFAGGATSTDDPGTPDQNVCYLAGEPGVYTNFGGITIENEEVALLFWNGEWTKQRILIGIREVNASVDNQVGTPSVDVSYSGGELVLTFHNLKGEQGETGDPAGFGTIGADINGGVGTPGVSVETSGDNTAKNLMFHFTNLKGETGVTSVVATIDDTSGTPSCQVSLVGQQLTLAFSGLKGLKGDTGVSADYPITIYNGLDSDATDQALAAAQGKVLDGKVSQLEAKVIGEDIPVAESGKAIYLNGGIGSTISSPVVSSYSYSRRSVTPGDVVIVNGTGGGSPRLWGFIDSSEKIIAVADASVSASELVLLVPENAAEVIINTNNTSIPSRYVGTNYVLELLSDMRDDLKDLDDEVQNDVEGIQGDISDIQDDITKIQGDITKIQGDIYDITVIEYHRSDFKGGYIATDNKSIGDTITFPTNTNPVTPESTAGYLILNVKNGDTITAKYKALSNKYCRAWLLLDTTQKITAWSNPQSNSDPQETLNYLTTPLVINIENDGYLLIQFPISNYNDNSAMEIEQSRKDLKEEITGRTSIEICVPDEIVAVVGDTLQLYYHSVYRCVDYHEYAVKVTCDIGSQYPRYYEVTPLAGNIGNHTLTFAVKDNNNNLLGTKSTTLKVVAVGTNPSSELNVLCLGASATNGGQWASEFKRRLVGSGGTPSGDGKSNIQFVGRMDVTFDGKQVKLEATGGYKFTSYTNTNTARYRFNVTAENEPIISVGDVYSNNGNNYEIVEINISAGSGGYFSCEGTGSPQTSGTLTKVSGTGSETISYASTSFSGNPFVYNGVIDMQQYADDYCNPQNNAHGRIDVVYTELFGNGTSVYTEDFTTRLSQMQTFINQVRDVFPNCKFCIGLFWNPDVRGGLGRNYGADGTWSDPYGIKYTNMNLCNALQKYITDNNLSGYVYILNWLNEFDTWNDMGQTQKAVNPRSTVTEIFGTNGVHPSTVGYYQMADTAWRLFVAKFCQS